MKLGFIGLGKMGKPMVLNLLKRGHEVVAYTPHNITALKEVEARGAIIAESLRDLARKLPKPRVIFLSIRAGKPVDETINELLPELSEGDIIIDAGNSYFKDSIRRANWLKEKKIYFLDVGTSGGIEGAEKGVCFMIGGDKEAFEIAKPIFESLSAPGAYAYLGESGAGHYVKMVHNGVLYAILEAYGEGFALLKSAPYKLDLPKIAEIWKKGSVVRSWLLELAERALKKDPELSKIGRWIGGGETGRWAAQTALELEVPVPAINAALNIRYSSRNNDSFIAKVISALRYEFGGHEYKEA
ncbi:MAG: decarboxylating 6-phosphogluconate dehydrogenase [Candidatus Methanomethylicia archaeon]